MSLYRTVASHLLRPNCSSGPSTTATCGPLTSMVLQKRFHLGQVARLEMKPPDQQRRFWMTYWRFLDRMLRSYGERFTERMIELTGVCARQFGPIAAQRLRRASQVFVLYRNLGYDERLLKSVIERLGNGFRKILHRQSLNLMLGASIFCWDQNRISDDEVSKAAEEITYMRHGDNESQTVTGNQLEEWERVINKRHITVWRKAVKDSYLYEYKVFGSYDDLPARAFFTAQVDLEFRKQWDKLVIKLGVIDKEKDSETELVQWIMHYPYPMYSREYIYVRRCKVDQDQKLMVIINKSTEDPEFLKNDKYIRVDTYQSRMVIRPHKSFDENGFDYVLTYFDDPKSSFPSVAYNWMASTGVPDFVDKVHTAALLLHERRKKKYTNEEQERETNGEREKERIPM